MTDETLAQLTRRRLDELGLGMREAVRNQTDIGPWDISLIVRGRMVDIAEPKARALARAIKVPIEQVRAAREHSLVAKPLELPGRFNLLNDDLRRALVAFGDYLLRFQRSHEVSPSSDDMTPAKPAGRTPRRKGVRKVGS